MSTSSCQRWYVSVLDTGVATTATTATYSPIPSTGAVYSGLENGYSVATDGYKAATPAARSQTVATCSQSVATKDNPQTRMNKGLRGNVANVADVATPAHANADDDGWEVL